jgi:hypothetical protein
LNLFFSRISGSINVVSYQKKEKIVITIQFVSIQILQYEFLGPIKLDEWGPPMEKVVYLILSRKKDSFNIIYVGDCEKTDEKNFFVNNSNFKCWIQTAGSENSLYLAILPMFESNQSMRKGIIKKILRSFQPPCNPKEEEPKPDYVVRTKPDSTPEKNSKENSNAPNEKISCPCCGSDMKVDKVLEKSKILKCTGCGLSDTRLNS